jgi:hypothetical protein
MRGGKRKTRSHTGTNAMKEAEIDTWFRSAPVHQVRAVHSEAELSIAEWRRRINRPDEQRHLASFGEASRCTVAAAGRAAIEVAIITAIFPKTLDAALRAPPLER